MLLNNWQESVFAPLITEIGDKVIYLHIHRKDTDYNETRDPLLYLMSQFFSIHSTNGSDFFQYDLSSDQQTDPGGFYIGNFIEWANNECQGMVYIGYDHHRTTKFSYYILFEDPVDSVSFKLKFPKPDVHIRH